MAFIRGELRFKNAELINALQRKKMSLTDLSNFQGSGQFSLFSQRVKLLTIK